MQGIADIFLSFFYFPGPAYPQYLLRPFCRPPTASRRAAVPIADEKPSLHATLGGFPLSHRMRKRIGGVRRTLSARLFPKKYDRQCFAGKSLPPPLRTLQDKKKAGNPRRFPGFPYRIRRLFAQLGNRFLCGGHVVAGGHLFEGFDRLRLHLLGVVCRAEDEIDVALLGLVGLRSGGGLAQLDYLGVILLREVSLQTYLLRQCVGRVLFQHLVGHGDVPS